MKNLIVFLLSFSILMTGTLCFANNGKDESADIFIKKLRASHPVGTWGILKGEIAHKRRKSDAKDSGFFSSNYLREYAKIKVGTLFTSLQVVAMIKVTNDDSNEESEIYKVGQSYNGDPATVIASNLKNESLIGNFGISPADFTMAFLYWDVDKNDKQNEITSVKGLTCRIVNLINSRTKEKVKVYASVDYYYPLKVQWMHPGKTTPYRTMVIDSFKHDGELAAPSGILITGPGWKTKIDFDKIRLGYSKNGNPEDLFQ